MTKSKEDLVGSISRNNDLKEQNSNLIKKSNELESNLKEKDIILQRIESGHKKEIASLNKRFEDLEKQMFDKGRVHAKKIGELELENTNKFNALMGKFDEFRDLKNKDLQSWFSDFNSQYAKDNNDRQSQNASNQDRLNSKNNDFNQKFDSLKNRIMSYQVNNGGAIGGGSGSGSGGVTESMVQKTVTTIGPNGE
jgi:Mg2+ and Co2+ transporter CorA